MLPLDHEESFDNTELVHGKLKSVIRKKNVELRFIYRKLHKIRNTIDKIIEQKDEK